MTEELMLFRYQERMHITYEQAANTPWSEIERAHYIWSLDAHRVKVENRKAEIKAQRNN